VNETSSSKQSHPRLGDKFVCGRCGLECVVDRSHEEMVAFYEIVFRKEFEKVAICMVCDDCWKVITRS
jgi:transcription elongation factor Elf1